MFLKSALVSGLLAAGSAATASSPLNGLLQPDDNIDNLLARDARLIATLTKRQDANPVDTAPLSSLTPASGEAPSNADLQAWAEQTRQACMDTLANLNGQASNPSGIAVCYNLPFLDNTTGVFQAELRMFNVSAPVDPWVGVTTADVSMTLSYLGATVQNMNGNFTKRNLIWNGPELETREPSDSILVERQSINTMTELKVLMYVGRVNSNLMGPAMTQ